MYIILSNYLLYFSDENVKTEKSAHSNVSADEAKLRSPSIFKPKFPKVRLQNVCITEISTKASYF